MNQTNNERNFVAEVRKKVRRLRRARAAGDPFWQGLLHMGALGWMFVLPVVAGAFLGHWAGRVTQSRWLAVAPLLLGLLAGAYVVFRQLEPSLTNDEQEGKDETK